MVGRFPDDLQGHGDTGKLGQDISSRADARVQLAQVGYRVHHTACEDDKEMYPGDQRCGSQEGVDEAQEEEGIDGLHVVAVGPGEQSGTVSSLSAGAPNPPGPSGAARHSNTLLASRLDVAGPRATVTPSFYPEGAEAQALFIAPDGEAAAGLGLS